MAQGELKAKVSFVVAGASEAAKAAVEKAGGTVQVIEKKVPVKKTRPAAE